MVFLGLFIKIFLTLQNFRTTYVVYGVCVGAAHGSTVHFNIGLNLEEFDTGHYEE